MKSPNSENLAVWLIQNPYDTIVLHHLPNGSVARLSPRTTDLIFPSILDSFLYRRDCRQSDQIDVPAQRSYHSFSPSSSDDESSSDCENDDANDADDEREEGETSTPAPTLQTSTDAAPSAQNDATTETQDPEGPPIIPDIKAAQPTEPSSDIPSEADSRGQEDSPEPSQTTATSSTTTDSPGESADSAEQPIMTVADSYRRHETFRFFDCTTRYADNRYFRSTHPCPCSAPGATAEEQTHHHDCDAPTQPADADLSPMQRPATSSLSYSMRCIAQSLVMRYARMRRQPLKTPVPLLLERRDLGTLVQDTLANGPDDGGSRIFIDEYESFAMPPAVPFAPQPDYETRSDSECDRERNDQYEAAHRDPDDPRARRRYGRHGRSRGRGGYDSEYDSEDSSEEDSEEEDSDVDTEREYLGDEDSDYENYGEHDSRWTPISMGSFLTRHGRYHVRELVAGKQNVVLIFNESLHEVGYVTFQYNTFIVKKVIRESESTTGDEGGAPTTAGPRIRYKTHLISQITPISVRIPTKGWLQDRALRRKRGLTKTTLECLSRATVETSI